jgi:hypothetical protein
VDGSIPRIQADRPAAAPIVRRHRPGEGGEPFQVEEDGDGARERRRETDEERAEGPEGSEDRPLSPRLDDEAGGRIDVVA